MINKIITFSIIILFIIGCCKKETVEPVKEKQYLWKRDSVFFNSNAIFLNSFASDDKLHLSAINSWSTIDTYNNHDISSNFKYYLNYSIKRKIPITKNIFAFYWKKKTF